MMTEKCECSLILPFLKSLNHQSLLVCAAHTRLKALVYLKHHVKHHGEPALARVLPGRVQRRQIKQAGARLVANRMDQHLFPHTCGSDQQDRLDQRSLLMNRLRA